MKNWIKQLIISIRESEEFAEIKSFTYRDLLNGEIFTKKIFKKNYGLLIMFAVLMLIYITNRYSIESKIALQSKLKKEIQDLKYESLTISAELMKLSRQSSVVKMVNEKGLEIEESPVAPVYIVDSIK
jgi:cell division protein FtsL